MFSLSAQVNLQIEASRVSGVEPLYIFFDATLTEGLADTNALVNADFSWNFDVNDVDPNGRHELTKGMVAGHVFEQPGSYLMSCTVIAPNGSTDTERLVIEVEAFSGTTYCVADTGWYYV